MVAKAEPNDRRRSPAKDHRPPALFDRPAFDTPLPLQGVYPAIRNVRQGETTLRCPIWYRHRSGRSVRTSPLVHASRIRPNGGLRTALRFPIGARASVLERAILYPIRPAAFSPSPLAGCRHTGG